MSGIDAIAEKLKNKKEAIKKTRLDDYKPEVRTSTPQHFKTPKLVKTTIYLTEEANQKLNSIYANRIMKDFKSNKYDIFCEAIELLFEKEKTGE